MNDNSQDSTRTFDVRQINLLKVTSVVDVKIVIAECDRALSMIKAQVAEGFGDGVWLKGATRANDEIMHKRNLAVMKMEALQKNAADRNFRTRFIDAARVVLDKETFNRVFDAARTDRRDTAEEVI